MTTHQVNSAPRMLAVLIDGDNAQPSLIEQILAEAAKYGVLTTRRIYGDWTTPQMSGWKDSLNSHAVQPIQQFRYTVGKNATDSALIIDAMDLLHSGSVGGFCIVSSDSDYTRLAIRIREQGLFVMGIGRSNTPKSFVNACQIFVYTENLAPDTSPRNSGNNGASATWQSLVLQAIDMSADEDSWALLSDVGTNLRKLNPAFDSRTYGHKQLSQLIRSQPSKFELNETHAQGGPTVIQVKSRGG